MTLRMNGPKPISRATWTRLLGDDSFAKVRSDEQLARLVMEAARTSSTPYATLLAMLLGSPYVDERLARDVWAKAVEHRRLLARALGRPVHLRVAALDLVLNQGLLPRPLLVDRDLVNALVKEASSDTLTGLPNRRHFMTVLENEIRQRHRPSVAMVDVDGLKRVNDTHGHARGDTVLRGLAAVLRAACRKGDVAARLGGDEFAVIFAGTGEPAAMRALRRVEAAFIAAHVGLRVGLSYGVVAAADRGDATSLLREADRRMYALKRDRWRAAPPAPRIVALYATQKAARLLSVHKALAAEGVLVVPARTAGVARSLVPVLAPRLLLSDLRLPPHGGLALLEELERGPAAGSRVLVAPPRWRGLGRGTPRGVGVLPFPPGAATVARLLRGIVPAGARMAPGLASRAEAQSLLAAIERLVGGAGGDANEASVPAEDRPEVDLVRSLLGA